MTRQPATTNGTLRHWVALVGALALCATVLGTPAAARAAEKDAPIRTDPGDIAGYTLRARGAPATIRFFDQVIPVPADPGDPNFELTVGHVDASLKSGPLSRALASDIWPGTGVGEGMPNFANGQEYPIKAEADYPGGDTHEQRNEAPGGGGMVAIARGLDVKAVTRPAASQAPAVADFATMTTTAESTVKDGHASASVNIVTSGLKLLGGIVSVDEMHTAASAVSDAVEGTVDHETTITGLTVAGIHYVVDEEGVHVVQEGDGGDGGDGKDTTLAEVPAELGGQVDLAKTLGLKVEALGLQKTTEEASAKQTVGGVRIVMDTRPLRQLVDTGGLQPVLDPLPDDLQGQVLTILTLAPTIEIVLGRADVAAAATQALSLDLPSPTGAVGGVVATPGTSTPLDLPSSSSAPGFGTSTGTPPDVAPAAPAPQVAPGAAPVALAAGAQVPEPFGGLGAGLVLFGVVAAGLAAYGLRGLTANALGLVAAGGCPAGASCDVPDLRTLTGKG